MLCCNCYAQKLLSPLDYGWKQAKSDSERFMVLYKTHKAAIEKHAEVDYSGIKIANVAMEADAPCIPLTDNTDFKGLVLNVTKCERRSFMFSLIRPVHNINIPKDLLDKGDFSNTPELSQGNHLLIIEDKNRWAERLEYADSAMRKDIIVIKDGKAQNAAVMPYNNKQSNPSCSIVAMSDKPVRISNLTINRGKGLHKQAFVFDLTNLNDLYLDNITLNTPESELSADWAFRIRNCANVTLSNITINGTYSQEKTYGYGIGLNNVYNFQGINIKGKAKWGIFGNYNVNTASLLNCDINRWDIHCYGKDVKIENCTFRDKYNQYASVYGSIEYTGCTFIGCLPYLNAWSFNCYVKHKVKFTDCTYIVDMQRPYLLHMRRDDTVINPRAELKKKFWPELEVHNLSVKFNDANNHDFIIDKLSIKKSGKVKEHIATFAK